MTRLEEIVLRDLLSDVVALRERAQQLCAETEALRKQRFALVDLARAALAEGVARQDLVAD